MFRSGSPRPLSKPRNTFSLFTTPLSRVVRPMCSIRRLARKSSASIDIADIRSQWEKHIAEKPTEEIRSTWARLRDLYRQGTERYKTVHLVDLFPCKNDGSPMEGKSLEEYLPQYEQKISDDQEVNLPLRYPQLTEDSSDFYSQYAHNNQTIMKKRPYESSENSNEGTLRYVYKSRLFELLSLSLVGPSPKRTLISRQNLIKTKSPVLTSLSFNPTVSDLLKLPLQL